MLNNKNMSNDPRSNLVRNQVYDKNSHKSILDKRIQFKYNLLIISTCFSKLVFLVSLEGKCGRKITNLDFKFFLLDTYKLLFKSIIPLKYLKIEEELTDENKIMTFIKHFMSPGSLIIPTKKEKTYYSEAKYYIITVYQPSPKKKLNSVNLNLKIKCDICLKENLIMYIPKLESFDSSNLHKMYHGNEIKPFKFNLNAKDEINVVGLSNLGNTCYFNSGLQCIIHCKYLANYFLDGYYIKENKTGGLVQSFYELLIRLKQNFSNQSPNTLLKEFRKKEISYDDSYQHDSPEFVSDFLNALSDELKRDNLSKKDKSELHKDNTPESFDIRCRSKEDSIIKDLFYGNISNTYLCPCSKTVKFEQFLLFHCPLLKIASSTINCYYIPKLNQVFQKEYKFKSTVSLFKEENNLTNCFLVLYIQESNDFLVLEDTNHVMDTQKMNDNKTVLIFPQGNIDKRSFLIIPYCIEKGNINHLNENKLGENIYSFINKKYLNDIKYTCPFSVSVKQNEFVGDLIEKIEKILNISNNSNSDNHKIELSNIFKQNKINKIYVELQSSTFWFGNTISKSRHIIQTKINLDNEELNLEECLYLNKICPNYSQICKKCKMSKELRIKIVKLPIYLIILLKRGVIKNRGFSKLNNEIQYPSILNIYDCVDKEVIKDKKQCDYSLIAINAHSGSVNFGHYIAVINQDNEWYYISDSTVKQVSQFHIKNAVLLFYQKVYI